MRWDELFADIENQLEHELDAEQLGVAVEEERLRLGRLGLRDRVASMASTDQPLGLVLHGGENLEVHVDNVGRDWLAGEMAVGAGSRAIIVPLAAVAGVVPRAGQLEQGLRPASGTPPLSAQLGLAFVLRDLCRRRSGVELVTHAGTCHGTIDRVGRDHLDLAEHDAGEARRDRVVRRIRIVPFEALLLVRI